MLLFLSHRIAVDLWCWLSKSVICSERLLDLLLVAGVSESFFLIERHEGGRKDGPIQSLCRKKARKLSPKARTNETTEVWCEDSILDKDKVKEFSQSLVCSPRWPVPLCRVACRGGWLPFEVAASESILMKWLLGRMVVG
jgi:hypothetical protein